MNIKDIVRIGNRLFHLIFWMIVGYLAGDSGMGFYFISFIIFHLVFTIIMGGIKETVARMVQVRIAKGFHSQARSIFKFGLIVATGGGALIGLIFWLASNRILASLIGYTLPASVLGMYGLYFVIYAICNVLMGYYQGLGNPFYVLVGQVAYGLILVIASPIVIKKMYVYGAKVGALLKNSLYANINGALGAVFVQIGAAVVCLLILVVGGILTRDREMDDFDYRGSDGNRSFKRSFVKTCFINMQSKVFAILSLATMTIVLIKSGYKLEASAKEIFTSVGVFADKFLLTISFAFIFFVDYVDKEKRRIHQEFSRDEHKNLRNRCSYLLKNTFFMMIPVAATTIVLAKPIVMIFFGGKMSMGVTLVRSGAVVIAFMALAYSSKAILSAIDFDYYSLIASAVGYIAMIGFLSAAIKGGINISYLVYAYLVYYLIQAGVAAFLVYRLTGLYVIDIGMKAAKVLIASVIMIIVQAVMDKLIVMNVLLLLITLIVSVAIYYLVMGLLRGITNKDINSLKGTLTYYPASIVGGFFNNNR